MPVCLYYLFVRNFFGAPPKEGWNRRYYRNGNLQTEFFAHDEKIEGVFKSWYENRNIQFWQRYKNGVLNDTSFSYYENGKIMWLQVYEDNKLIREINYSNDGLIQSEFFNPSDSSKENFQIKYFPNGNKEFETRINNVNFEGMGYYYYTNGKEKMKGKYKQGNYDSIWIKMDSCLEK